MKRLKFHRAIVAIAMMFIGWLPSLAHDFEVDGIYYYKINSSKVAVTYKGYSSDSYSNEYVGDVVIPSSVKYKGVTYSVTIIGNLAFNDCSGLTSVEIPNSVTSIEWHAFYNCSGLTSVTIGNSVTSIGDYAFRGCSGLVSVRIPDSVTSIGSGAFYGCSGLTNVIWNVIKCSDFDYEKNPFYSCSNITSFTFGDKVEYIPARLCNGMKKLTSIEIPNSVTSIGEYAFRDCESLKNLVMGNSVTTIGRWAFEWCSSLTSIEIPYSVTSIGDEAFYMSGLKTVVFYCPSVSLGSLTRNSNLDLVFLGGEIKEVDPGFPSSKYITFYVSPSKVEIFRQKFNGYTVKELTTEQIEKYCDSEKVSNEYDVEKSGTMSFSGSGSGTESDPFLIFNPVQLNDVRNSVGHSGVYYKLMSDIDMTEWIAENNPQQGWQPIGNLSSMFKGTFIGNGKKITGLTVNRSTTDYVGFFGYVHSAKITDLTIEGNIVGNYDTGGIFGKANVSEIDNCRFIGNVKGNGNVGGVVGYSILSNINNTHFSGEITAEDMSSGGIIGRADIKPVDSIVITDGCVTGTFNANIKISNVSANCDITSSYDCVGGIVGYLYTCGTVADKDTGKYYVVYNVSTSLELTNATHNGSIKGSSLVGGIIGQSQIGEHSQSTLADGNISASVSLDGCHHIGNISSKWSHIGGVIGRYSPCHDYSQNSISLSNCSSIADIVCPADMAGGLIGRVYASAKSELIVNNSYALCNIYSTGDHSGGLFGKISSGTTSVSNCYALGNINSTGNYSGGLCGSMDGNKNSITDCYFSGAIYGTDVVGGLLGLANAKSTTIVSSYSNASSINGNTQVGGIVGFLGNGSSIESCISANEEVNARKDEVGRVYGATSGGATLGTMNTAKENKGLATMIVNKNGVQQLLEDGPQHGTNVGRSTLKLKSTYQGLGWNFTTNWTNQETESYPYKQTQTAPPVLTSKALSGATVISGKSVNGGIVYVVVGDKTYTAQVQNNAWSVTVEPLTSGEVITAYAKATDLAESYRVYQTVGFSGTGTESDPYQIYTAQELANVNGTGYYMLMNDIDLTEWINKNSPSKGWLPLGRNGSVMSNLIGNNCTISGLWCNTEEDYTALIAMAENITISDLTVKVADNKVVKGGNYSAVIIGKSGNCTMTNCHAIGAVEGSDYLGGLAGSILSGSFDNCSSTIKLSGGNYLGGICGQSSVSISSCKSDSEITGSNYLGGIAGNTSAEITICKAACSISGKNNASGASYAGGIVGYTTSNISQCYSSGMVSQEATSSNCYVGGIVGYNETGKIENCNSSAEISSSQYAAGIAGYSTGTIQKCYSSGDISAELYGAGIVGYNDGTNAVTKNCIALNNILNVNGENGIAMRVVGGIRNGAPTPEMNNYALKTMAVSVNGITQKIYDDNLHGASKTADVLMQAATYSNLGWDMSSTWSIKEGEGYPYIQVLEELFKLAINVTAITLDCVSCSLQIGDTKTLTATITPDDATNKVISWSSSNENVATVSEVGVVTAMGVGTATIIAKTTDGTNIEAECEVTVSEPIEEINFFSVADIEVRPGNSFAFPVELINEDAISGFQCDIYLPEGITAELYEDEYDIVLTDRKTSSHSISSALQPDGSIRVAVFSSKSKAFYDNSGAIFEIMLSASEDLQDVTQIAIKNIVLSTPELTQFEPKDVTANVILKKYILGDANGDETVNITDAVGVVNTILGNEPASFVFDAADVVADGTINITDAIGVVNIILNGQPTTTALAQQPIKATLSATSAGNKFYIEDFSIEAGESKEIAILLTNDVAFSGFQSDIYLPEGLSIYQEDDEYIFDLSSRATRSHSISSALQADGAYRIACFSSSSKDIKENEGELVYFTVIADDDFSGTHTITVKNTIFTQSDLTQYNLDETTATVTGPNIQAIVDVIADEDANAPVEYYNMQGIRVENPQNGIFIRRQGKKVEKVILK